MKQYKTNLINQIEGAYESFSNVVQSLFTGNSLSFAGDNFYLNSDSYSDSDSGPLESVVGGLVRMASRGSKKRKGGGHLHTASKTISVKRNGQTVNVERKLRSPYKNLKEQIMDVASVSAKVASIAIRKASQSKR